MLQVCLYYVSSEDVSSACQIGVKWLGVFTLINQISGNLIWVSSKRGLQLSIEGVNLVKSLTMADEIAIAR